jgi:hypothetical protein
MFEPRFPAWRWPLAAVLGLVSVLGAAQTQPSSDSPVPSTRTSIPAGEWDALMRPLPEPERKAEPPATARPDDLKALIEAERQTQVEQLVRRADQFRAFRQNHPDDKNAQEARRQEGLLLLQAAFSGEPTQVARRRQLVADVLADTSLPAEDRFEVAAYAGNLTVEQGTFASPADRLAAFERVARDLVARFPEVPAGYESLLAIAKAEPDDRAKALLSDLAKMPAPAAVKAQAAEWLARYALVGSSVANLAESTLGAGSPIPRKGGHPTVIYTWSVDHTWSVEWVKRLAADQADNIAFIGVNLDPAADPAHVRELAVSLPGEQIAAEARAAFAKALLLDEVPLVYLADRSGRLQTVTAQNQSWDNLLSPAAR